MEQTLVGHKGNVDAVAVIDDQHIISASVDHTLKVWNVQTGKEIASLALDDAPQCIAAIRQESRILVVASGTAGSLYCLELVQPQI